MSHAVRILLKALHQRQGGRHQAILAKLALTHCQDALVKVNLHIGGIAQPAHVYRELTNNPDALPVC